MKSPIMNAKLQPQDLLNRQIESGLYLSPAGCWVYNEKDAFDFPDMRSALPTCEMMQDGGVEMLLVFDRENEQGHRL